MNVMGELLANCKHQDGIKPEYDQHQLAADIATMPEMLFDELVVEMNNAVLVKDLMSNKRVEILTRVKP